MANEDSWSKSSISTGGNYIGYDNYTGPNYNLPKDTKLVKHRHPDRKYTMRTLIEYYEARPLSWVDYYGTTHTVKPRDFDGPWRPFDAIVFFPLNDSKWSFVSPTW